VTLQFGADHASAELAEDDDLREVFLEEAHEVLANASAAHAELAQQADDLSLMTTLRRDFHTLKGSSRMVGLKDFGEAAWSCEQLYNTHLADQSAAAPRCSTSRCGAWATSAPGSMRSTPRPRSPTTPRP